MLLKVLPYEVKRIIYSTSLPFPISVLVKIQKLLLASKTVPVTSILLFHKSYIILSMTVVSSILQMLWLAMNQSEFLPSISSSLSMSFIQSSYSTSSIIFLAFSTKSSFRDLHLYRVAGNVFKILSAKWYISMISFMAFVLQTKILGRVSFASLLRIKLFLRF